MSVDEGLEPENTTEENEGTVESASAAPELTREELLAEVSKLRKESAGRRVAKKEVDAKLKEYEEWKLSQLSEVDRAKAETAKAEETVRVLLMEKAQRNAAKKAGLDPDYADRLRGETEEEMVADAKALVAKGFGTKTSSTASNGLAGKRGKPVGAGAEQTESDWFRKQFLN